MLRTSVLLLLAAAITTVQAQPAEEDVLCYASLNFAIHEGQFDGIVPVSKLQRFGDFGLGSEEKLAGELVVLDGKFFTIPSDGKATTMEGADRIAFAAIKRFVTDTSFQVHNIASMTHLESHLENVVDRNTFAAIRITGEFSSITFRSFEEQQKPYKPVDEVTEIKFRRQTIEGTLVGFYTPESAAVLNSPTYHFHFIDKPEQTGGHVLECNLSSATVEIDYAKGLYILLPEKQSVRHIDLNKPLHSKKD